MSVNGTDVDGVQSTVGAINSTAGNTAISQPSQNVDVIGNRDGVDEPVTVTITPATAADGSAFYPVVKASLWPVPPGSHKVIPDAKTYDTALVDEQDLRIAHQYDLTYPTRAALLADLEIDRVNVETNLDARILIENDENYLQFWTILRYTPSDELADANGLVLEDIQTYRTSDFFAVVDWYATGYGPSQPPLINYTTLSQRNLLSGPTPAAGTLCNVADDGSGNWVWTLYDGTGWTVVARKNSTVQLSAAFYDPTRVVYGADTRATGDIANRDGSWELRALFNAFRDNILSKAQLNEIFFSMLRFFHSQQDEVNWAFKTSFLNVIGFNDHLNQPPVQTVDTTQNLLDYIDEVKPYHVKLRNFTRILTPDVDQANVHASDFDKPVYYDTRLNAYRNLHPEYPLDMALMANTAPWSDWVGSYQNTNHDDPASIQWNPVRNFRIKILFDRTDYSEETMYSSGGGWDIPKYDVVGFDGDQYNATSLGSALARIRAYYEPLPGMISADDVAELMKGVDFQGTITDGGNLIHLNVKASEWDITPYDTVPYDGVLQQDHDNTIDGLAGGRKVQVVMNDDSAYFGLRDPQHAPGHPEELAPIQGNEAVAFTVHSESTPGTAEHFVKQLPTRRVRRKTAVVPYGGYVYSADSVLVFIGGKRAQPDAYTVDFAGGAVTATLPLPRPDYVMVHAFGLAATSQIIEFVTATGDGQTVSFDLARAAQSVAVIIDGQPVDASEYTVSGLTVTLRGAPAKGAAVLLVNYETPGVMSFVGREVFPVNESQEWTPANPVVAPVPEAEHTAMILDIDGLRAMPPFTRYDLVSQNQYTMEFCPVTDTKQIRVWADGVPYAGPFFIVPYDDFDLIRPAYGTGLYFIGTEVFINDASLIGKVLTICSYEGADFIYSQGVLQVKTPLAADAVVQSTTFQNPGAMAVETQCFVGDPSGTYVLPLQVDDAKQCLVSVNGRYLTVDVDYGIAGYRNVGWDTNQWDRAPWGGDKSSFTKLTVFTIPGGQQVTDRIVITTFRGAAAQQPSTWGMISAKPSLSMMGDPKLCSDWGFISFDTVPVETPVPQPVSTPLGDRYLYRMDGSWEVFQWEDADPAGAEPLAVHLAQDLGPSDTTITLTVPVDDATADVRLAVPDAEGKTPGVVLIAGERIEYYTMDTSTPGTVVLGQLRRGTRATRVGEEERRLARYTGDGTTHLFALPGANGDVPQIRVAAADGSTRKNLLWLQDFTFTTDANGLTANLAVAPAVGTFVTLGQTFPPEPSHGALNPLIHAAGTVVRNVTTPILRPIGSPFRGFDQGDLTDIQLINGRSYLVTAPTVEV